MEKERIEHNFEPVFNENSKVLILGTFPSVKSREQNFYYGHPQNRFWKLLALLTKEEVPQTILEKKEFLLRNGIAIWDVVKSCRITGSSDSSIKEVVANDISSILECAGDIKVFANGAKAYELYKKYIYPSNGIEARKLPSTSPANAAFSLERLAGEWQIVKKCLK